MTRRTPLALAGASLLTLGVSACSTTFDTAIANSTTTVAVTTTLPTGAVADLLPLMLAEVKGLSEKVAANDGDGPAAVRIAQYWDAMKAEITTTYPDLVPAFEFVVRRCQAAADRSRPADADRAYRNLQTINDAILG
ncbi:MAG: hypothetical protein ACOYMR_14240 [Ilumatobacteraceae bacterium]